MMYDALAVAAQPGVKSVKTDRSEDLGDLGMTTHLSCTLYRRASGRSLSFHIHAPGILPQRFEAALRPIIAGRLFYSFVVQLLRKPSLPTRACPLAALDGGAARSSCSEAFAATCAGGARCRKLLTQVLEVDVVGDDGANEWGDVCCDGR